jgi:hypothetical protein
MNLVTIEEARAHCKSDPADDAMLTLYVNAAEAACSKHANRNIYADQAGLDAGLAALPTDIAAANAAYDTAIAAAASLTAGNKLFAEEAAAFNLRQATARAQYTLAGMVLTDDVKAAVLLTAGHFYANREEVIAGPAAAAVQLPFAAATIMDRYYHYAGML